MRIDGDYFDVRIDLADTGSIRPGQTLTVALRFFSPERAIPRLTVGKQFSLREGRTIAVGKVLSIHAGT
jgi:GTPase